MDASNEELGLTRIQQLLTELYDAIRSAHKIRRTSDGLIARRIGVKTGVFNAYVNNTRTPSMENAIIIADAFKKYLGAEYRAEWLKVLGYPDLVPIHDDVLLSIVENWDHTPTDAKKVIYEISQNPDTIRDTYRPPGKN